MIYYKNYTDKELANYAANLPFQDDLVYELAERLGAAQQAYDEMVDDYDKLLGCGKSKPAGLSVPKGVIKNGNDS